jgi:hypothetical protein
VLADASLIISLMMLNAIGVEDELDASLLFGCCGEEDGESGRVDCRRGEGCLGPYLLLS